MSRLIDVNPQVQPESESEYEFGYYTFDTLPALYLILTSQNT